jgi:hypothetical protein
MTLDPLLYFVDLVKLTHLPAWILIVVWVLLAINRRLSIRHAGSWRLALSNGSYQIYLLALLLVLDHNLRNGLERWLLWQFLQVLRFCNGFIRLHQAVPTAHHILHRCLLFCIRIRIATTFILILRNLRSLSSIGNHSFAANLNPFPNSRSFVNFALLEQLTFGWHRLKYPWCDLLFAHVSRPIIIVDFDLLDADATTGQNFRNLNLFMVVCVRRTVLSVKNFLKIWVLTYSYCW